MLSFDDELMVLLERSVMEQGHLAHHTHKHTHTNICDGAGPLGSSHTQAHTHKHL